MFVRVADELPEIQRAWAAFETAVGLRGRKFYGAFDPATKTYSVCAVLRPGDDPAAFGCEPGTLPGGRYVCLRLLGEPPAVYEQIGPTAQRLAQRPDADHTRPRLESARRPDVTAVLVPVVCRAALGGRWYLFSVALAEVSGLRIAFEQAGEGPPLVLVHGAVSDCRVWKSQLDAFADEFTV